MRLLIAALLIAFWLGACDGEEATTASLQYHACSSAADCDAPYVCIKPSGNAGACAAPDYGDCTADRCPPGPYMRCLSQLTTQCDGCTGDGPACMALPLLQCTAFAPGTCADLNDNEQAKARTSQYSTCASSEDCEAPYVCIMPSGQPGACGAPVYGPCTEDQCPRGKYMKCLTQLDVQCDGCTVAGPACMALPLLKCSDFLAGSCALMDDVTSVNGSAE